MSFLDEKKVKTNMTMIFVRLTPELAAKMLENNGNNRSISERRVSILAKDISDGNWDEKVGATISVDANGVLRDGQHRCAAVVKAGIPINVWICRNVSEDGIYDNNRARSVKDQLMITRPDIEAVLHSNRAISVIKALIEHESFTGTHTSASPKQIADYIDKHKGALFTFFKEMPASTRAKVSVAGVYLSLYLAFLGGVDIKKITEYYQILVDGMSSSEVEYPIIAYRNYLLNSYVRTFTNLDIARCQYSLKKYLTKACTKRSFEPKELIWAFPRR